MQIEAQKFHEHGKDYWKVSINDNPIPDLVFFSERAASAFCGIFTQAVDFAKTMEHDIRLELESQGVLDHLDPKGARLGQD